MIISHLHKYVFVELPRTGTSAVSRELRLNYGGERFLRKHSSYQEFLRIASHEEKQYFVFTCIRNPLDDAVSHYFKLKTDHRTKFSNEKKGRGRKRLADRVDAWMYKTIRGDDLDFPTFFRRFHLLPYNNWSSMSIDRYNYIMRFESLQDDFARVLQLIGLEPVRPLPHRNVTAGRRRDYWTYYTPEIIPRARRIFGPYMKQWGYAFPPEWGDAPIPWWNKLEYNLSTSIRKLYWSFLRPKI